MDELQKLRDKLKRYRAMRSFTDDKRTIETLDMMIAETEDRLAQIERGEATDQRHE